MIRDHADAVLALLDAVPNLRVYDTKSPEKAAPGYVVARFDSGHRTRDGLLPVSGRFTCVVTVYAVGEDADQCRLLAEAASGALLDVVPTVPGRSCFPIEHLVSQPTVRDDDVTAPQYYAIDQYQLASIPA